MFRDYIQNGQAHGTVGERLMDCGFDTGLYRPFYAEDGKPCVTINTGQTKVDEKSGLIIPITEEVLINDLPGRGIDFPIANAQTSLRKDAWLELDRVVIRAARQRLRAWGDLSAANTVGGFDGMAKTVLEWENMDDPGEAIVDMDGLTPGRSDAPQFQLEAIPLPITHSDFFFSKRQIATSRNSGTPLNTTMAEAAGRRVAETIEQTLIGVEPGLAFGNGSGIYSQSNGSNTIPRIYGYTNFPDRNTKADMPTPTGANGPAVLTAWLALRELLFTDRFYGPYIAYTAANYDQFLDNLFSSAEPSAGTLRSRLLQIDGISDIRRLDFLPGTTGGATHDVIFVQMTSDVVRAINGMNITTVQWPSDGGLRLNFKVMAIHVPNIRSDINERCGIGHGTST